MKLLLCTGIFLLTHIGTLSWAQQEITYIKIMTERLENAKKYTYDIANAMPEENYGFKPTETEMTFSKQVQHMAQNLEMICTRYLDAETPSYSQDLTGLEKEIVLQRITNAFDFAITTVKNLSANELNDEVDFFAGKKNKMQMVNLLNDHQAHHRGQLVVYLRLKGVSPPPYTGW